jgi:hypothetical protein
VRPRELGVAIVVLSSRADVSRTGRWTPSSLFLPHERQSAGAGDSRGVGMLHWGKEERGRRRQTGHRSCVTRRLPQLLRRPARAVVTLGSHSRRAQRERRGMGPVSHEEPAGAKATMQSLIDAG